MRILLVFAAVAVAHGMGLFTLGFVTSASMEPTLPPGSLFLALPLRPDEGDIVVYRAPSGERVVHRAVEITPDGLITRGDANERTDQQFGLPPVDPSAATVVPTAAGTPLAIRGPWLKPLPILGIQALLLAVGLRGLARGQARKHARGGRPRLRPSRLVMLGGAVLLAASPLLQERFDAPSDVGLRGLPVPTVTTVTTAGVTQTLELGPLADTTLAAGGEVEVVTAPALPGARLLSRHGAAYAMIPSLLVLGALALVLRQEGA